MKLDNTDGTNPNWHNRPNLLAAFKSLSLQGSLFAVELASPPVRDKCIYRFLTGLWTSEDVKQSKVTYAPSQESF